MDINKEYNQDHTSLAKTIADLVEAVGSAFQREECEHSGSNSTAGIGHTLEIPRSVSLPEILASPMC